MPGPITAGLDHNFFARVTVSSASFQSNADVAFNFRGSPICFTLNNEGTGIIEYSLNGTTLMGDMTPGEASENLKFENRKVSRIWFRLKSGSPSVVRVEGWSRY